MKKLPSFYAMYYSWNDKKIKKVNVLAYLNIRDLQRERKKFNSKKDVTAYLKREFMYRFWSKAEWEIIVSDLSGRGEDEKIDVWYQIEPNLEIITDLVIEGMNWKKLK